MKFKKRIKQLKKRVYKPYSGSNNIFLYIIIIVTVVVNPMVTVGVVEYFSARQNRENLKNVINSSRETKEIISYNQIVQENRPLKYSSYWLLNTVLGILTYISIAALSKKLSTKEAIVTSEEELNGEADNTALIKAQNKLSIETIETIKTIDYEPYVLLADMSHELRSPLNAILGFVQIMQQELSLERSVQDNIAIINRSGERLLLIINDVIDLAKIETNRLTLERNRVDFYAWLDNIEQGIKTQAHSQGWEFTLVKESSLPQYICIDERRLRQIFKNLIDYCLTYTSTVEVSLKVACEDPATKVVASQVESPIDLRIYFEVENTAFLATPEELATLFDPAVRVKQKQKSCESSSLNLPLSRKLAQLMGGDITVSNNDLDRGITFRAEIQTEGIIVNKLPIKSNFRRIVGLESNQTEYRILVVDDSKTNRQIMLQLLEPVGFKVKEAVNGQEAVDIWLQWQPHMIWMDLRMPVMNGYEATQRIRSYPHLYTPIVAISASTLEAERSRLKAAGCDDFVGKPFSEDIIFDKIAQHLGIRYIYESVNSSSPSNFRLTADTLNVMPRQWLNQVEQAAVTLDRDLLMQLLQEIPPEHTELKNALQMQVDNFDFDKILTLASKSANN